MKRLAVVVVAVFVTAACNENPVAEREVIATVDSSGLSPRPFMIDNPNGKCVVHPGPGGSNSCVGLQVTMSVPVNYHCGWNCDPNPPQIDPIVFRFSKPVYGAAVEAVGPFFCPSPDLGTITYYAHNKIVEVGHPVIEYLEDCAPGVPGDLIHDSISSGRAYTPQYLGGVDSIVVARALPDSFVLYWPPFHNEMENRDAVGQTFATYDFYLFVDRQPDTNCLTGDPILDQQATRDFLKLLWDSSGASLASSLRRESGGYLFEDSTGAVTYRTYFDRVADTPCESNNTPNPPFPGDFIGVAHSHPFTDREQLPNNCRRGPPPPGYVRLYDAQRYGGPSAADIQRTTDDNLPMYIVDSVNIYVMAVGTTQANALSMVKSYPRRDSANACTRL